MGAVHAARQGIADRLFGVGVPVVLDTRHVVPPCVHVAALSSESAGGPRPAGGWPAVASVAVVGAPDPADDGQELDDLLTDALDLLGGACTSWTPVVYVVGQTGYPAYQLTVPLSLIIRSCPEKERRNGRPHTT